MKEDNNKIILKIKTCEGKSYLFTWQIYDQGEKVNLKSYWYGTRWAAERAGETALRFYLEQSVPKQPNYLLD